jgi:hypothetical protein
VAERMSDTADGRPRFELPQLLLGLIALAVGLFLAGGAVGDGLQSRAPVDTIEVAGSARRPVEADSVSWSVRLSSHKPTPQAAVAELDGWTTSVRTFVVDGGARGNEITVDPVSLSQATRTDGDGNEVTDGYQASRAIRVKSGRLDVIAEIAGSSVQLIRDGIPIDTDAPEYVYTKLASHRASMVADAGKDAKKRAEALVKVGGGRLGRIREVRVGDFQVTSRGGTDFESGGSFDRSARQKDIVVVVHLTFELR